MAQIHISKDPPRQHPSAFDLFDLCNYNTFHSLPTQYRDIGSSFVNVFKLGSGMGRIVIEQKPHNKINRTLNNLTEAASAFGQGRSLT
jgi:hypothetical protein